MDVLRKPDSAIVVAHEGDELVVVRQPRGGAGAETLELPGGQVDEDEAPADAAARELEEECGLAAGAWRELGSFWAAPDYSTERVHAFEATDLVRVGPAAPGEGESVAVDRVPLRGVMAELSDASSLAALALWLQG